MGPHQLFPTFVLAIERNVAQPDVISFPAQGTLRSQVGWFGTVLAHSSLRQQQASKSSGGSGGVEQ